MAGVLVGGDIGVRECSLTVVFMITGPVEVTGCVTAGGSDVA